MKITPKFRKAIIVILPLIFALTASVAVAMLVGSAKKANDSDKLPEISDTAPSETLPVFNENETESGNFYSEGLIFKSLSKGSCALIGTGTCHDSTIKIPMQSKDGEMVTEIASGAFSGSSAKEIILPNSVMVIRSGAFSQSSAELISIGDSVMDIEDGAFKDCPSLCEVVASGANAVYTSNSGVLYSRDLTKLLLYPSSKADSSYTIPKSVKTIEKDAFQNCKHLKSLSFGGTEKQWRSVLIESGNSALDSVKMSFAPAEK